jgi:hypothetical protein
LQYFSLRHNICYTEVIILACKFIYCSQHKYTVKNVVSTTQKLRTWWEYGTDMSRCTCHIPKVTAWWKASGFYGSSLGCVLAFLVMAPCCGRPVCQCFRHLSFPHLEVKVFIMCVCVCVCVVPDGRTLDIIKYPLGFLRMSDDYCPVIKYVDKVCHVILKILQ